MTTCPSCGAENPDGQKFCGACGTQLVTPARPLTQERKVVTTLFCDLVGFTRTSESADPEDVDRMLAEYFSVARKEVEAFGGIVEKFIGDAVVGVFGVPAAHEDDPERAVRAGLRICEAAQDLTAVGDVPLKLRIGINTGEAFVRLGIAPGSGEGFFAGDAVNTASRLQAVAPEMGVAVGPGTYEATSTVFDYEEMSPEALKGKTELVRVFWAKSPRSRIGADLTRTHTTPFIGREIDLAILKGVFDKTRAHKAPQLVLVLGEPGIGKSRIVAELRASVGELPDLVTWRQGRCLPYGEGITFWALGEILKAHTGILESDDPATAEGKLELALPEGTERAWFRQRLLPLLGIEATSTAEREELFTAWRRFLEHIAERDPTVLVFEDLHWADPAMLAFLENLADRAEGVPLLIVGTARPELFEHHPGFTSTLRNVTPVGLAPLSEQETVRLLSALLGATTIPTEVRAPILERAGGNPLYAEEFVRLLKDADLLVERGSSWQLREHADIPFPDSVQALIAARLDTLSPERKAMLADAAVVGKVFWAGAVAEMGSHTEAEVKEAMRELSRKELVRPQRQSTMEGESEYAFWHVLTRDVAYAELPRAARASRHVAAAHWIESKAPERLEDLGEVLAYHYASALELARAAGETALASELEAPAHRFLMLSGERALGLDNAAALDDFERALALTPQGHPGRAQSLARFGRAAYQAARYEDAAGALEEAAAIFRDRGESLSAARAMTDLAGALSFLNDPRCPQLRLEVLSLLEPLPPGRELVDALGFLAGENALAFGRLEEAVRLANRSLSVAADLGLARPALTLGVRADARYLLGDPGGLEDFREALDLATQAGDGNQSAVLYNNFGITLRNLEGPGAALKAFDEGRGFAEARGLKGATLNLQTSALPALLGAGKLDRALELAEGLGQSAEEAADEFDLMEIRSVQTIALVLQGRASQALGFLDQMVAAARRSGRPDLMTTALGCVAVARAELGEAEASSALLAEIEATPDLDKVYELAVYLPMIVRTALKVGEPRLAEDIVGRLSLRSPYDKHAQAAVGAALAEARGQIDAAVDAYGDAAARWERFGVVPEAGFALLGRGRCLLELARPGESTDVLRRAAEIFAGCGMRPASEENGALLARATAPP
jgi:class 3 adenylate cyclase/tetratricopeptide (TPR) repeat protein